MEENGLTVNTWFSWTIHSIYNIWQRVSLESAAWNILLFSLVASILYYAYWEYCVQSLKLYFTNQLVRFDYVTYPIGRQVNVVTGVQSVRFPAGLMIQFPDYLPSHFANDNPFLSLYAFFGQLIACRSRLFNSERDLQAILCYLFILSRPIYSLQSSELNNLLGVAFLYKHQCENKSAEAKDTFRDLQQLLFSDIYLTTIIAQLQSAESRATKLLGQLPIY